MTTHQTKFLENDYFEKQNPKKFDNTIISVYQQNRARIFYLVTQHKMCI